MGFTNADQLRLLFYAAGMGFLTGVYYDLFRVWRRLFAITKVAVFFQDVLFGATSAAMFFLFSLALTEGRVRGYTLLAAGVGFFAYRYTVGNSLLTGVSALVKVYKRVSQLLRTRLLEPLLRRARSVIGKVCQKCRNLAKKTKIFFKKVLQRKGKIVYNHRV